MGIFENIFQKKQQEQVINSYFKGLTAYQPVFTSWGGKLYESELVRSAIDARARHISKLRIEVTGTAKPKLAKKLKVRPNAFQTWSQFLYRTSTILDMQNTCFIVPVLNPTNLEITGYYPVLPSRTEILQDTEGNPWLRYTFSSGKTAAIEYEKCGIMTKFQYESDFYGESNRALNKTMSLIDLQNQGIGEAVKNSATYRFMARVNNFTKPEDLRKERANFSEKNLRQDDENGGLLLFPNTYSDIKQIENTPYKVDPRQMELIQTNVFNYYGVNEAILQNKATGDEWNSFYEGAIEVFSIQLAEVMSLMTFTEEEIFKSNYINATAQKLQYMSNTDKLNISANMADRGLMTINEIREIWNLPPLPNGDIATIRGEYYVRDESGNLIKAGV